MRDFVEKELERKLPDQLLLSVRGDLYSDRVCLNALWGHPGFSLTSSLCWLWTEAGEGWISISLDYHSLSKMPPEGPTLAV